MAKLTDIFPELLRSDNGVRLTGVWVEAEIYSVKGEEYYAFELKKPIMVRSSMNPGGTPVKVEFLLLRRDAAFENATFEGNEEEGFYVPGWIADYSEHMRLGLYQPITTKKWFIEQRRTFQSCQ